MEYLNELRSSLTTLSKETLIPALSEANKAIASFNQNQLTPALDTFRKEQLGPAVQTIKLHVKENTGTAPSLIKVSTGKVVEKMVECTRNNPGKTALCVLVGSTILAPDLVLWIFGLGSEGPRKRTAAASYQRGTGRPVAARSAFATAQSAAMGGYGVSALRRLRKMLALVLILGGFAWYIR
ncbi:hypothetical protein VTL71DRAFT_2468 [Oculimacula yallundae]|uniref:Uncharacterized protein n=1 Tax=Oculimacula yallundae TaxID=86028 RepID=A0ABR4C8W7_9HELO